MMRSTGCSTRKSCRSCAATTLLASARRCRIAVTELNERNLTRSARKVDELIEDVDQTGSFRFWR